VGTPERSARVVRNTAAQVVGRNLIAVSRLAVASLIVHLCGKGTFGEYSLVLGILTIAEWVLDFGTTEVFVREICREPGRTPQLLRTLTAVKVFQVPVAIALLVVSFWALHYPPHVREAGLVGAFSLIFFAGVLVYRPIFRADLTIEREATAELVSVLFMIPLVAAAALRGGGLSVLIACHVASRVVFFAGCYVLGRGRFRPSVQGVRGTDVRWTMTSVWAMGLIGFLAGLYETSDVLLLSKLGTLSGLAYYSAAQRLVWPMLAALGSIGGTLYPLAASYWPQAREEFEAVCQRGFDTVVLLAGLGACSVLAGAEFFMRLLGPDLVEGASVLRVLALVVFVKAIPTTLAPLLYVVHAQKTALRFVVVALLVKVAALSLLILRFGYLGAAFGALGVEILCGVLPVLYFLRRYTGQRLRLSTAAGVALITVVAAAAARFGCGPGLPAALAAPALYLPLVLWTGAIRLSDVQLLLRWKAS
jgi:O-antigen/teichoic acid export membrane protein